MTRLVLVHGIKQEGRSSAGIQTEWLEALLDTIGDKTALHNIETTAPFYGDILFEQTKKYVPGQGRSASAEGLAGKGVEFYGPLLKEIAEREAELNPALSQEVTDASASSGKRGEGIHKKSIIKLVKIIEKISPLHGSWALKGLPQAYTYLNSRVAQREVDNCVRPHFETNQPVIVVAHSLGTIVTFKLLRELGSKVNVPLLITLGSPLGLKVVRKALGSSYSKPAGVGQWVNGFDPSDFVALARKLSSDLYDTKINEISDIKNGDEDPHAIGNNGYLTDKRVADKISSAIKTHV